MIYMLNRVIGASGSGKTEYLFKHLKEAVKKGKKCYVIVPEQQSVAYESALCELCGDGVNLYCEVLNFERLPNRIARDFGGLAVNNIDKGGACALLSLISESLKPKLLEYGSICGDADFATSMFTLISRMKMALITPETLLKKLEDDVLQDKRLLRKLNDITLIYSAYEKYFGDELFDPRDALTRLVSELPEKPFFKDSYVFIDSYYTFTKQEYEIIREIIAQSRETYISFTVDNTRSFFDENQNAAQQVANLAKGKMAPDFYTSEPKRGKTASLRFVERNLWRNDAGTLGDDDGSVRLISAKNRFDEVEAAAAQITEYIRNGGRYRDITVLVGKTDNYQTLVDSVFSRAEIPCYMSSKEALITKPIFAFLLSSLDVIIEDFSLRSMKRYIKSGYTELDISESDAILNYASSWNLRGKAWYGDAEWTLDPEGYREGDLTARGAKLLNIANTARNKVVPSLSSLREFLSAKDLTVSKGIRALYDHLISMSADERLRKSAERYLKKGEREKSEREIQLWKLLINIFDQLDSVCGDFEITPKRLQSLLKLMCDCYSLGAIPASTDSVTFGDASLIRAGNSKMVVVLGVCDGEFPSSSSTGFFDREEAVLLESVDLVLADTLEKQLNTAGFLVYAAFSAPTERLVLLSPRSEISGGELRPSTAWLSVKKMLPNQTEIKFEESNVFYSRESIASYFPVFEEGEIKNEIEKALIEKQTEFFRETPSVCDRSSEIVFDKEFLNLSPSKFEKYALCPFSFFGNYLLELKPKKQNEFSMPEIGNFIHKILDEFMRECVSSGRFVCPTDEQRKNLVQRLATEYLYKFLGKEAANDKRFMHTYSNMIKTIDFVAENLVAEFSESRFLPSGFEFKIGLKDPDIPAIEYDIDGKKVYLRGSIDRVDVYELNGVKYVRVIDYKTYSKKFSVDLLSFGIDTQLLHYLFAYCDQKNGVPAGVMYYIVTLPNVEITGRESEEKIREMIEKSISRSGILLKDSDVVFAMSPDCSFVPVSRNKDGSFSKTNEKNLKTKEEFEELSEQLKESIKSLSHDVFCGKMDIAPNDADGKADPCKNCTLADICRANKQKEEDDDDSDDE